MSLSLEIYDFALKYVNDTAETRSGSQNEFLALAVAAGYTFEDVLRVGTIVLLELVDRLVIKDASFDLLLAAVYDATPEQREKIAREVRLVLANGVFLSELRQTELTMLRDALNTVRAQSAAATAARGDLEKAHPGALPALDAGIRSLQGTEAALLRQEQAVLAELAEEQTRRARESQLAFEQAGTVAIETVRR